MSSVILLDGKLGHPTLPEWIAKVEGLGIDYKQEDGEPRLNRLPRLTPGGLEAEGSHNRETGVFSIDLRRHPMKTKPGRVTMHIEAVNWRHDLLISDPDAPTPSHMPFLKSLYLISGTGNSVTRQAFLEIEGNAVLLSRDAEDLPERIDSFVWYGVGWRGREYHCYGRNFEDSKPSLWTLSRMVQRWGGKAAKARIELIPNFYGQSLERRRRLREERKEEEGRSVEQFALSL